ncbi:MAG: amino acid adenylation domain-containing protein [Proteobacteria bacterium]|nr:amino acid adenylation domain-containing protein [Pseudomonadota bacterium]
MTRNQQSLLGLFAAQVAAAPGRIAFIEGAARFTYADLARESELCARRLIAAGIRPGDVVALERERSWALLTLVLGVLKAGGIFLPLGTRMPEKRLADILAICEATLLISARKAPLAPCRVLAPAEFAALVPDSGVLPPVDAARPACIFHTSGTTGTPKGMRVGQAGLIRMALRPDYVTISPGDRVAHFSNPAFDALSFEIWGALLNGAALVSIPQEEMLDLPRLAESLAETPVDVAFITTGLFNLLLVERPDIILAMREVLFGGESANGALVRAFLAAHPEARCRLVNIYGPTEATTFATFHEIDQAALRAQAGVPSLPIGRPLRDTPIRLGEGENGTGEILIGGSGVVGGYIGRPDLTAEKFVTLREADGTARLYYRTGDLGWFDETGNLHHAGRIDDQIKLRGFRIELGEIEQALLAHPAIRHAALALVAGDLCAYLVLKAATTQAALRAHLAETLPAAMIPHRFLQLDSLPINANGKVDRAALAGSGMELPGGEGQASPAALNAFTGAILADCATILGRAALDPSAGFIALGGDSLKASQLANTLSARLGIAVPLKAVIEAASLSDLAASLKAQKEGGEAQALPALPAVSPTRYEVSGEQRRLWLAQAMQPGSTAYSIPLVFDLDAMPDIPALEGALKALVKRHGALRTRYREAEGTVWAEEMPAAPLGLDLRRDLAPVARQRFEQDFFARPFDLAEAPLMRGALVAGAAGKVTLLLCLHHIAVDGWSLNILLEEISRDYAALKSGASLPESLPAHGYGAYAEWQRALTGTPDYIRQRAFWRESLADLPRGAGTAYLPHAMSGRYHAFDLPPAVASAFERTCAARSISPFSLLSGLFAALLAHHAGKPGIALGVPFGTRPHRDFDRAAGMFVNTLVARYAPSPGMSLAQWMEKAEESAQTLRANHLVGYDHISDDQRQAGVTGPLFEAMFVLENTDHTRLHLEGLDTRFRWVTRCDAKFPLTFFLHAEGARLAGLVEYDSSLFSAETIACLARAYADLIARASSTPEAPLAQTLATCLAEAREAVMRERNATAMPFPEDARIETLFREQARRTPDAPALQAGDRLLSYRALDEASDRLAHLIAARAGGPGGRIGIALDRSPEMVITLLAILKAGAAYVPLDPAYPAARLDFMIRDSGLRLIVSRVGLSGALSRPPCPVLLIDTPETEADLAAAPASPFPHAMKAKGEAYVIYTSGSTGQPKGTVLPHRAVVNYLCHARDAYFLPAIRAALVTTSLNFDATVTSLVAPLITGRRVDLPSPDGNDIEAIVAALFEAEPRLFKLTPAHLASAIAYAESRAPSQTPHVLVVGGEQWAGALAARWAALLPEATFVNEYGPTETTVGCSTFFFTAADAIAPEEAVPIGRPIRNTTLHILDEEMEPCATDEAGELYIGGAGLADGYLARPNLTAARFVADPFAGGAGRLYRTGDKVMRRADGELVFLGRFDDQVKVNGYRIELGEVEAALAAHEGVHGAAVLVSEEAGGGQALAGFVLPAASGEASALEAMLRAHLAARLPDFMVPRRIRVLDTLPLNENGKVDRAALRRRLDDTPDLSPVRPAAVPAAETQAEAIAAELGRAFEAVLGYPIENDQHFFEAGAGSLALMKIHAGLKQRFEGLNLVDFFAHPTLDDLAAFIAGQAPVALPAAREAGAAGNAEGDVALVGMTLRFPGANSPAEFWDRTRRGEPGITVGDADREGWVKASASLEGVFDFDPSYFGISAADALVMDPQQRHLLMGTVHALQNAGYWRDRSHARVGLILSSSENSHHHHLLDGGYARPPGTTPFNLSLMHEKDFLATRIAHLLDLRGPAFTVQTGCSSSLVGVHLALAQLRAGEADLCVVGGATINADVLEGYAYQPGHIFSKDGHCRPFSDKAGGTVPANGYALVVLKPLAAALADSDRVLAVIKGSAINNDGRAKVAFTAPAVAGQAAVVAAAMERAAISPAEIGYVETHGTATALGDPIEIAALTQAFAPHTEPGSCAISALKSQIGHLGSAAGLAGLIRAALARYHGVIPPSLGYDAPNPGIDFAATPFKVATRALEWPRTRPYAGVSSFGMGGTNAHVILGQAPPAAPATIRHAHHCLLLGARSESALRALAQHLAGYLEDNPHHLAGVAAWCLRNASDDSWRGALVVSSADEAIALLQGLAPTACAPAEAGAQPPGGTPMQIAAFWLQGGSAHLLPKAPHAPIPWDMPEYPFDLAPFRLEAGQGAGKPAIARQERAAWFHQPGWARLRRIPRGGENGAIAPIEAALRAPGIRTFRLPDAPPANPQAVGDLLRRHCPAEGDMHLVQTLPLPEPDGEGAEALFTTLMVLVQGWEMAFGKRSLDLTLLTHGAFERGEGAWAEMLAAPMRAIRVEYPRIRLRLIDLPEAPDDAMLACLAGREGFEAEGPLALRAGHIWQHGLQRVEIPATLPSRLRPDGVYLVTGGGGGIGRAIITRLLEAPGRRVIAFSRRAGMADLDPRVIRIDGDIADPAAVAALAERIRAEFGSLAGIIHAAGDAGGGLIALKNPAMLQAALAAKVTGARLLMRHLAPLTKDAIILCSSLSALIPVAGQYGYSAANAFLDALALAKGEGGPDVISINWPAWRGIGMSAALGGQRNALADLATRADLNAISTEEGWEILETALTLGLPRLVVSPLPPEEIGKLLSERHITEAASASQGRAPEAVIAEIYARFTGTADPARDISFYDLGGDSLAALDLVDALNTALDLRLALPALPVDFSLADLLEAAAGGASKESAASGHCVRLLRAGAGGEPVFLIHPVGGDLLCYRDLVRAIDPASAVYGIEDPDLESGAAAPRTIEAAARAYLAGIRDIARTGNIRLAGWSYGAAIAYEIARLLTGESPTVARLVLIDPPVFDDRLREDDEALKQSFLAEMQLRRRLDPKLAEGPDPGAHPYIRKILALCARNSRSLVGYRPRQRLVAQSVLFVAGQEPDGRERPAAIREEMVRTWRQVAAGAFHAATLRADHYSILEPVHAARIAEALNRTNHDSRQATHA